MNRQSGRGPQPTSREPTIRTFTAVCVALLALLAPTAAFAEDTPEDLTFTWVGDVTMGSHYGTPPGRGNAMFRKVHSVLQSSDVTWGNLEGALSKRKTVKCGNASVICFQFVAPPANAAGLAYAGFDGMNIANNHAYDAGPKGLTDTKKALAAQDLLASGAPGTLTYVDARGRKIAIIGFGTNVTWTNVNDLKKVRSMTKKAAKKADIVVVLFHGGAEGADQTRVPRKAESYLGENRGDLRRFAHAAIDAGADLVAGSGPHVLRGMEKYKNRLIAYSLGNFAGNDNFAGGGNLSLSGILTVDFGAQGVVTGGKFDSVLLARHDWPTLDKNRKALKLVKKVSALDFGKNAVRFDSRGNFKI